MGGEGGGWVEVYACTYIIIQVGWGLLVVGVTGQRNFVIAPSLVNLVVLSISPCLCPAGDSYSGLFYASSLPVLSVRSFSDFTLFLYYGN